MAAPKLLLIGRNRKNSEGLIGALEKRYKVVFTSSGKQGLALAKEFEPQVIVIDAISMRTPGYRVCETLREGLPKMPIIHLHPGPSNGTQNAADVVLYHPFTSRKLINSIERILEIDTDEIIRCGPFAVNIDRRILIANGQETQLTPKQSLLIETFLRHPGETLERKTLMEKVWDTDYMGDTRTLDVHIRWIRKALEAEGSQYLKTVRGVGYKLEVPM